MRYLLGAGGMAVLISACPGNVSRPVAGGSFTLRDKPTTLVVDRKASALTLSTVGGAPVQRAFTARVKGKWFVDCRMNMKAHELEVLEVAGGALADGDATLERPVVVAACAGRGVWMASVGADGAPDKAKTLVFEKSK